MSKNVRGRNIDWATEAMAVVLWDCRTTPSDIENMVFQSVCRPNVVFAIRAYNVAGRMAAENVWKDQRSKFITDKDGQKLILWPPNGREYITFQELALKQGRSMAREELPFLFKAFEQGQKAPPRPGTKRAEKPRAATIHEYLDWTVTASEPQDPDELDFAGFRVFLLFPRFRLQYPPPDSPYTDEKSLLHPQIGAPMPSIPHIMVHNKPICAATVRVGPNWLEVPFFATQESRRNKGIGRALLECIEDVARNLEIPRILLCSTDDTRVKNTWRRFVYFKRGDGGVGRDTTRFAAYGQHCANAQRNRS